MTSRRISISWLELLLITSIVLSGLALHQIAEALVTDTLRDQAPLQGRFDLKHGVVAAKEKLTRIEAKQKHVRARWTKEHEAILSDKLRSQGDQVQGRAEPVDVQDHTSPDVATSPQAAATQTTDRHQIVALLEDELDKLATQRHAQQGVAMHAERTVEKVENAERERIGRLIRREHLRLSGSFLAGLFIVAAIFMRCAIHPHQPIHLMQISLTAALVLLAIIGRDHLRLAIAALVGIVLLILMLLAAIRKTS